MPSSLTFAAARDAGRWGPGMSTRLRCWTVVVLVAMVGAGLPRFARAQQQANPCAVPDALLSVGETDAARRHYVTLLEQNPNLACALAGLSEANASPAPQPTPQPPSCSEGDQEFDAGDLSAARAAYESLGREVKCAEAGLADVREVERLCRQGAGLLAIGRSEEALVAYKAALEKNPEASCAVAGVSEAAKAIVGFLCSRGDSLLARHRDEDALAAYKAALERDPTAACAHEGIRVASPGWLSRTISEVSDAVPTILVGLLLVLLLGFAILMLAWSKNVYEMFTNIPFLRAILRPRLSFSPINEEAAEAKVAASLLARVQKRLHQFQSAASGDSAAGVSTDDDLDFGSPDETFADLVSGNSALQKSLGALSGLSEHGKVIAGVINIAYTWLPIRQLALSGVLGPPSLMRATLSMSVEKDARLVAAAVLEGPELANRPDASHYLELGERAALWTQYVVARTLADEPIEPRSAESYMFASRALDLHLIGDDKNLEQARVLYREALSALGSNYQERIGPLEAARSEMEATNE
jgi:tetratricopeptide (TPR) repeat protein